VQAASCYAITCGRANNQLVATSIAQLEERIRNFDGPGIRRHLVNLKREKSVFHVMTIFPFMLLIIQSLYHQLNFYHSIHLFACKMRKHADIQDFITVYGGHEKTI
jgi:hypothetical protein